MEIAILGGGNFVNAIANIVARNGFVTHLWMRDASQVADCLEHRENRRYLPGHTLEPLVRPTTDLADALARSAVVFVTVPSRSFRELSARIGELAAPDSFVITATKGIEGD